MPTNNNVSDTDQNKQNNKVVSCVASSKNPTVLLAAAMTYVENNNGDTYLCRSLLDSGSESSFITSKLCDQLNLQKQKIDLKVVGISQLNIPIQYKTEITLTSYNGNYRVRLQCLIVEKICEKPINSLNLAGFKLPNYVKGNLADNFIGDPPKIDILLGANLFWDLLRPQQIKLGRNLPIMQKTVLGWIVSGPISEKYNDSKTVKCNLVNNLDIQEQLKQFWELEQVNENKATSPDDEYCENRFRKTTIRNTEGRFMVSIPFKTSKLDLGKSLDIACKRFQNLEKKLDKNVELKHSYVSFMNEYIHLGHMSKIQNFKENLENSYYMPHHCVIKNSSLTTKVRIVFDASCRTDKNISLNDLQYVGPVLQSDLVNILLRFRMHSVVLSSDVEKMYRQVLIVPEQRNYQRIIWRENSSDELGHYVLNTVTFGTAAGPYLAIRAMQQTAYDFQETFPKASRIILEDFYVDDLLTGTETVEEAIQLQEQITTILNSARFKLRKWVSNSTEVLSEIEVDNTCDKKVLHIGDNNEVRTLGLVWVPLADKLKYEVSNFESKHSSTKRELLSLISKIFDPLGLVGPCIVLAKIMMQQLWALKLDWDDPVPESLHNKWISFISNLKELNKLDIPRQVIISDYQRIELHAFSDSSEAAYGACLYIRTISHAHTVTVNLLCAKSKVAPIKKPTIPRLELCAALLATHLVKRVRASLKTKFDACYFWCDSNIVLCWLRMSTERLKPFVSNRVGEIQESTNIDDWHYVKSKDNPADLISRGVLPQNLANSIWFHGPSFLMVHESTWYSIHPGVDEIPETKQVSVRSFVSGNVKENFPFYCFASLLKTQRIVALCLRFAKNCKVQTDERVVGSLTVNEINNAMKVLVKLAQTECFSDEIQKLKNNESIYKGKLVKLSPFIDQEGLLRVGGRLKNADFNFSKKHPLLISGKHILSRLIFDNEHLKLLHAGPQLMLASVRNYYWPTGGRVLARAVAHNCVKCFKVRPTLQTQIMGDLPQHRTKAVFPFYATGVDYGGPFLIKNRKGRGSKLIKCYMCLFICLATKAIHIEPVSELTTNAFLATFKRFVARRGKPKHIYSDNGTNFVGASSQLNELGNFLLANSNVLTDLFTNHSVHWHFIPAHSPHFGGLWEAGIKSAKFHIKRAIGNIHVTFEDFLTLLVQIEGILNSRPIHPMSNSPNDFEPLTPSHFLVGRSLTALPDQDLVEIPVNRLSQFQQIQSIVQRFWKQWTLVYVSELQQRIKWTRNSHNLAIDDLVLIKDSNLPPMKWKMGRVTSLHPGKDGFIRVVDVQTNNAIVRRSIVQLCKLPVSENTIEPERKDEGLIDLPE